MKKIIVTVMIAMILLTSFNLKIYATKLESDSYDASELYKYEQKEDGTLKITDVTEKFYEYYNEATILELPDEINGIAVTSVLTKLNKIDTLKEIKLPKDMKIIATHVFEDCTNLEKVVLPEGLTAIGENAFYNCKSLKEITIPDNVYNIGISAFAGCTSLKKIAIPDNITVIKLGIFQNCTSLSEVALNENIKTIEKHAFDGCSSLTKVEIPKSIEVIQSYAFSNCTNLESLTIPKKKITVYSSIISNSKNVTIYGVKGSPVENVAKKNNRPFVALSSMEQVKKAGILMAAFAIECADTYSNKFYYNGNHPDREELVFNHNSSEIKNNELTLDCVGNLNLFVYQSTGLISSDFSKENDPNYLTPSGLKATDLFSYVGDIQNEAFNNIAISITNGDLQPGDLIKLNGHVAMYCGLGSDGKILCPENYDGNRTLTYKNFGSEKHGVWASVGNIYRIKEAAANELTFLDDLNTKEEIEVYAKKLAEAYFNGTATYNGETLTRRNYYETQVTIGSNAAKNAQIVKYSTTTQSLESPESLSAKGENETELVTIENIEKGATVIGLKETAVLSKYSKIEIKDSNGNILEDDKTLATGYVVECYNTSDSEEVTDEYKVVIYGDVTGKGNPSAIDALAIVKNKTTINLKFKNVIYEIAGRVSQTTRDNKEIPTAVDALMIIQERLGKISINQGNFEEEPTLEEDSSIIPIYTRADLEKVGSEEEWLVESIRKIYKMKTDSKYILMNDIDLSDSPWTPITAILTNTFEGNNHKITGMEITGFQTTDNIGLFSVSSANISHLTLENVDISNITYTNNEVGYDDDEKIYNIGAIVGYIENNDKIALNNCYVSGRIEGDDRFKVGGMIGSVNDIDTLEIQNCINNCTIDFEESWCIGGFVGKICDNVNKLKIVNSTNRADIDGNNSCVGGFVGREEISNIEIYNSLNTGSLSNGGDCGGFIGLSENVTKMIIYNCTNKGNLTGIAKDENLAIYYRPGYSGGIIGYIYFGSDAKISIKKCNNYRKMLFGGDQVGGIIGVLVSSLREMTSEVIIENCNNYAEITASESIGGIVGLAGDIKNLQISSCTNYETGVINGKDEIGGIIGVIINVKNANINNCSNSAEIISNESSKVGNIIGKKY